MSLILPVFFCTERESIIHLFFECCVAVNVWKLVIEVLGVDIGADYESVAKTLDF
jgi:hypothetical protein